MKFSIKDFFSRCDPNTQFLCGASKGFMKAFKALIKPFEVHKETADLVTFTEKILNEKLHFFCAERRVNRMENFQGFLTHEEIEYHNSIQD